MSLSKQLFILISILFMLIFGLNMALSINNSKDYLETESQSHAQDTATSLGLSLSPYMKDPSDPIIKVMANAIFDMGYYGEILLTDAGGAEVFKLTNDKQSEGVPGWFIAYLPMQPASASSEISSGWNISGTVSVTVNPAYAYSSLYRQAQKSLSYSLIALAISLSALTLVLRITLASLKRIDLLARKISRSQFETIQELPWTSEVRNVALSMNNMSDKLKGVIEGLNGKLETIGAQLLRDELTGVFKKSVFETDIKHLLREQTPAHLFLIKVDSLPELVKEHGSTAIDKLLSQFAKLIQQQIQHSSEYTIKAYRLYGGDFTLLFESEDRQIIDNLCKNLSSDIAELGKQYHKPDLAHIGVTPINPVDSPDSLLAGALEAYEQARLIGANGYYIRSGQSLSRDISAWKSLVFERIDDADYSLSFTNQTIGFSDQQLIMEEAHTQIHDQQGQPVPIAPFISIAEKYAKIIDLDKGVIEQVLAHIRNNAIRHGIAVNLSTRTIKNADFLAWLRNLLKNDPIAGKQLIFSFSAYTVSKDADTYVSFFYMLRQWGGQAMVKRFEPQSIPQETNKHLKPHFIRLARDIGNGINNSNSKYDFVHTMQEMTQLLDIVLLAENIQSDEDYNTLKQIGIKGASR